MMRGNRHDEVARNIPLFYGISFLSNFRLNAPVLIIYLQEQTGSLTDATSLLAIMTIGASLLDIPTGALADVFGRKTIIVMSWICGLFHLTLLAIGGSYFVLLLSMLAAAAGMALGSGANTAFLYDSLVELQREEDYKKISGRANGLLTLALGIAAPFGSLFASVSLALPFWLQLLPHCFGFLCTLFLTEPAYHKPLKNDVMLHSLRSAKAILLNMPLLLLLLISAFYWSIGETIAVIAPAWYQLNIPLAWIGLSFTVAYGLSALGFFLADALSTRIGDKALLLVSTCFTIGIILAATLLVGLLSVVLAVSVSFAFGVRMPVLDYLTNKQVASDQRATIGSIGGVLQRGMFAFFSLLAGVLADRIGVIHAVQWLIVVLVINIVGLFVL